MGVTAQRMFLAATLPEEARHAMAAHLGDELGDKRLPGKPVPPPNWHLTVRFLGSTEPTPAEAISAHLDQHLMVEPFRLRLTGLGGFPRERKASVLWIGIDGDLEPLSELAAECERAAVSAGFEPEGRPFHPHLTLSRIRPPSDVRKLVDEIPAAGIKFDVDAVTLYRSILGSGPARYEALDTVSL